MKAITHAVVSSCCPPAMQAMMLRHLDRPMTMPQKDSVLRGGVLGFGILAGHATHFLPTGIGMPCVVVMGGLQPNGGYKWATL